MAEVPHGLASDLGVSPTIPEYSGVVAFPLTPTLTPQQLLPTPVVLLFGIGRGDSHRDS